MFGDPFPAVEIGAFALFLVVCLSAARSGRHTLLELATAALYGLMLEQGDILLFGTYAYSSGFAIDFFDVPIAIGLCWAVIIYGCMRISDGFGLPPAVAPAADALLALGLDFAFDAVAIRQGLWRWDIDLGQAYFGVPAGNFYAWLFVAYGFSFLTRRARVAGAKRVRYQLLAPVLAYAGLILALVPFVFVRILVFTGPGGGMPAVIAVVVLFGLLVLRGLPLRRPMPSLDLLPLASRLTFHGYFLGAILALRIHADVPILLFVSITLLAAEVALAALSLAARLKKRRAGGFDPAPAAREPGF